MSFRQEQTLKLLRESKTAVRGVCPQVLWEGKGEQALAREPGSQEMAGAWARGPPTGLPGRPQRQGKGSRSYNKGAFRGQGRLKGQAGVLDVHLRSWASPASNCKSLQGSEGQRTQAEGSSPGPPSINPGLAPAWPPAVLWQRMTTQPSPRPSAAFRKDGVPRQEHSDSGAS